MVDTLTLDADHPWPWLEAFPESAERFFNGRDQEKAALFRCVLSAPVTVLFGKSGLGKSSLLQAGLFPQLREDRLLPVYIRLLHDADAPSLSAQIVKRLCEEISRTQTSDKESKPLSYRYRNPDDEHAGPIILSDDLWMELHRHDIELVDGAGKRWQPIFVLDQFEEIFSLCAQNPSRQQQLFYELGDLLEKRIPKALAERLNDDDELFDRLNLDTHHYRFLLSLREDYLPDLEEWSELIPCLALNRFRLLPMSPAQAITAVEKTGGALVDHQDAENIVSYLSDTQLAMESGVQKRHTRSQIEPALLGLMCAGLNEERIRKGQAKLKTQNLAQVGGQIVEQFYDLAFADLPESVHEFVEQHLITADGVRLAYPIRSIETENLANTEQLNTLVDKRLLRRESLESGDRIELVHDRLAQLTLQRRRQRQQRKEALRDRRRRQRWAFGISGLIVLLITFAGYMWKAESKARRALVEAIAARSAAEGSTITAEVSEGTPTIGLFKVLAGHRLGRTTPGSDALLNAILQIEYLNFRRLESIYEEQATVSEVTFSPNAESVVYLSGNILHIKNTATHKQIKPFNDEANTLVTCIALSPDGNRAILGANDGKLTLWDLQTGLSIGQPFDGHSAWVNSVAFSPDGKRIVSGGRDNTLRLWNAETGEAVGQPLTGHSDWINSVAFSPDSTRIVSGGRDKTLRLWNAETGEAIGQPLTGHSDWINSVVFSGNGEFIVSGSDDHSIRLWNAVTGQVINGPLTGHKSWVKSVAVSPDNKHIISGSDDNTLRMWDVNTGKQTGDAMKHNSSVISVAFSKDGRHIASGSTDNNLRIWKAEIKEPVMKHNSVVTSVAFSPDGHLIIAGTYDGKIRFWDPQTRQLIGKALEGHSDWVNSVAFSPDGKRIASGSSDKTLRLWDVETRQAIGQALEGHTDAVTSVAFSPDGKRIVSGSEDNTLRLWDSETGSAVGQSLTGHHDSVYSVAFNPDGSLIASGSADHTLRLWDAQSGQAIGQPLIGHSASVYSVAFSPDGNRIVSGSGDKTLRLWDAKTGNSVGTPLTGHLDRVHSAVFNATGQEIISGSDDNTLRLWNVDSHKAISTLKGHKGSVLSVAYSPAGESVISGSTDNTLRIWSIDVDWANELCKKLGRNMSHQEWREWISPEIAYLDQCPDLPVLGEE